MTDGVDARVRSTRSRLVAAALGAATLVGLAACDGDTTDSVENDVRSAITQAVGAVDEVSEDAVEAATRVFASAQGREAFADAGQPIDGDLSCRADATSDLTAVEITCSGTTVDGASAELTGTTSELPGLSFDELDGDFVGTVDGAEVFRTQRLGG